ncbi:MAG TPA: apolipoprotein N-acyltransferase [Candidatus Lumbricidophila sp.]|nr:apolipoprotein N-acyltransferase [Candidatus Lumbricidophila sp.]
MSQPSRALPWWFAIPIATLGGVAYTFAFPGASIWALAFVSIGLAIVPLIGQRLWVSFLAGLGFGLSFYLTHVAWTGRYLGPVPWIALSTLEALLIAVGAPLVTLAYRWLGASDRPLIRGLLLPAVVAALWVAREQVTSSFPYGGFPWGRLALSQADSPYVALVSWVGIAGLGYLMVFVTMSFVEWMRATNRFTAAALVVLMPALLIAALAVFVPQYATTTTGSLRLALVQGNGPAGYFDERRPGDVLKSQVAATARITDAQASGVDLVVWPEGSVDASLDDPAIAARLDAVASRFRAPILANTVTVRGERYFNTSLVWAEGRGITAHYDKRNPVPFGEYIPDREFWRSLAPSLVDLVQRGYSAGTNSPSVKVDGTEVGLAICFDVAYDNIIWEGARDGAGLYIMQTNNADFRGTDENQQQLAIARIRAVETGRSVVNLSTVGASQVIGANGQALHELRLNQPDSLAADVESRTGLTPAVALGGWLPIGISMFGLGALLLAGIGARLTGRQATRNR